MNKSKTDRYAKLFQWLHYLAYPFNVSSIYFLLFSFFSDEKAVRAAMIGNGLLLLGFGLGLQTLRTRPKSMTAKPDQQKLLAFVMMFLACAQLLLAAITFAVKEGGIYDPVGLGLCSCAVGLFAVAKEQFGVWQDNVGGAD